MMTEPDLSGLSVLLVDDENFSRGIVTRLLRGVGLKEIHEAEDGSKALHLLRNPRYKTDFVIADFNMPVMHGLDMLKAVRMGEENIPRDLPIAMLTGHSDQGLVNMAITLGVNAFLVKPVSARKLNARLIKMMEQSISDSWLKPKEFYASVNVRPVIEDLAIRTELRGTTKIAAPAAEKSGEIIGEVFCPVTEIGEGSVLSRDIVTPDGKIFMHGGTKLTALLLMILIDLDQLGQSIGNVWIDR